MIHRLAALALFAAGATLAQSPPEYPSDYARVVAAARKEGRVVVYGATDTAAVLPLIREFEAMYRGVRVEYEDMNTAELYNRAVSEIAAGEVSADVTWSSAMDLQVKLVNDGYALAYASPEIPALPEWAVWKNEAWGTTYEPAVFVYNKRLLGGDEVPRSHAELTRTLTQHAARLRGKVVAYDVQRSGVGFLLLTQDAKTDTNFWDLARAIGATGLSFQVSSAAMAERIGSGDSMLGYNVLGSYALRRAETDPNIGIVFPRDYTLVLSRIMLILKAAQHPNAARLWLDFILSRRGQDIIANQSGLGSIRPDVAGKHTAAGLSRTLGASLKPIAVGPGLLTYLDRSKRQDFLRRWQQAMQGVR